MQPRGNVEANEAPYDADDLVEPHKAASLFRHITGILQNMAPSDAEIAPSAPAPHAGGMTAAELQSLIVLLRSRHITTTPGDSESTNTIGKCWSVNHSTLMKYTLLTSESKLAPIFQDTTSGSRKMERTILQSGYDGLACTAAVSTNFPLVITKDLTNIIVNLVFW